MENTVILPQAVVKKGAHLRRMIVGERSLVANDCVLGSFREEDEIVVVPDHSVISKKTEKGPLIGGEE